MEPDEEFEDMLSQAGAAQVRIEAVLNHSINHRIVRARVGGVI